jgi:uncharacterized protein YutE (UPF0331/DUF86 family)
VNRPPLNKKTILSRLEEVRKGLTELRPFATMPLEKFRSGHNFAIAEHYLRRTLEAVFEIGAQIISRIPKNRATSYKEIALKLGIAGVVPREFAEETLVKMAGYRNRMIHFYYEISVEELHAILQRNLEDIEAYCLAIKKLLESPETFGFTIQE